MTSATSPARVNLIAGAAAVFVMIVAFVVFSNGSDDLTVASTGTATAPTTVVAAPSSSITTIDALDTPETIAQFSNLDPIPIDDLPVEAVQTLLLIADGGPYPYSQDDGTFQNREGILPDRQPGHYREYTVNTPGATDRGARRIVSGADGERFYTDDHYDSFREIVG